MPKQTPWPVDKEGLPTVEYLNSLDSKAKWERFWESADERSGLQGLIYLTDLAYGEPE